MNEYIQEKIKEYIKLFGITYPFQSNETVFLEKAFKDIYNRGVEDSLKRIPDINSYPPNSEREGLAQNQIRQQTIDNISKLLNNK